MERDLTSFTNFQHQSPNSEKKVKIRRKKQILNFDFILRILVRIMKIRIQTLLLELEFDLFSEEF